MRMKSSKYSEFSQCIIFHSLISKFARYTIQILQIFRVKQKKKKEKKEKKKIFVQVFLLWMKKGEKYPLKINRN